MAIRRQPKLEPGQFYHPGATNESGTAVVLTVRPPLTYMGGWTLYAPPYVCFDRSAYKAWLLHQLEIL